jgi:N-methylhydantoinase A
VTEAFAQLDARAERLIRDEDAGSADWRLDRAVDARFEGQLFELTLPLPAGEVLDGGTLDRMFRAAYRETYGYDLPDHTVQLVNLRLVAESATASADWPKISTDGNGPAARRRDILDDTGLGRDVPVRPRAGVEPGTTLTGPLIIEDLGATILVLAGQTVQAAPSGVLIIAEEEHAP